MSGGVTGVELLPCPFGCGGEPYIATVGLPPFGVVCGRCSCEGPAGDTPEQAIAAWNRRQSGDVEAKAETYAEWQQKRGMAMDTIDWAIAEYDGFMLDDDYSPYGFLDRLFTRLKDKRAALSASEPAPLSGEGQGYADAFYELATLMGIPARPVSPKAVWEAEMLPRLKAALSASPAAVCGDGGRE